MADKSDAALVEEMRQYLNIMKDIESNGMANLEGLKYGRSPAEKDFKVYATIGIVLLFFYMLLHAALKYLRFRITKWQPNVSQRKVLILK